MSANLNKHFIQYSCEKAASMLHLYLYMYISENIFVFSLNIRCYQGCKKDVSKCAVEYQYVIKRK